MQQKDIATCIFIEACTQVNKTGYTGIEVYTDDALRIIAKKECRAAQIFAEALDTTANEAEPQPKTEQ